MMRIVWTVFAVALGTTAWAVSAAPEVTVDVPGEFAGGEFQIWLRSGTGELRTSELWSYDPDQDLLEYVMTVQGHSWLVSGSSKECCVTWPTGDSAWAHTGGVDRETVRRRVGRWTPDVEVAGREYSEYPLVLTGDPPQLLIVGERTFWTFVSLFGEPKRRELKKWSLEARDPWSFSKLGSMGGAGPLPDWMRDAVDAGPDVCLLFGYSEAQFLSLDPLGPVGDRISNFAPRYLVSQRASSLEPIAVGDGRSLWRLEVDAATLHVDAHPLGVRYDYDSQTQWRNGLTFKRVNPAGEWLIEVRSDAEREPAVNTSFPSEKEFFRSHRSGAHVLQYHAVRGEPDQTVTVWTLTPEGSFEKTRTLDIGEASRVRLEE